MSIVNKIKKICRFVLPNQILTIYEKKKNNKRKKKLYNLGRYSYALSPELIKPDTRIGDFVSIALGAQIGPGNHPISFLTTSPFSYHFRIDSEANLDIKEKTSELTNSSPIYIGNDVWIGTNAVIMKGIKIGDGAIIGANAVVTHDVPAYAIVGGVPAKLIKYRFDKKERENIIRSKWWNLPDYSIQMLPLDNINESLNQIQEIKSEINNKIRVCFVITSCIYPHRKPLNNADTRSVFSVEKRVEQTRNTIYSIRKYCRNAYIILADNGVENPKEYVQKIVDRYIYVGDKKICRIAAAAKNKSIGEAFMLHQVITEQLEKYDLIFKMSGRYLLNENFELAEYDLNAFNFLNYYEGKIVTSVDSYREGSHSTRLYAFPGKYVKKYRRALISTIFRCFMGKSIEVSLPIALKHERFFYHKKLGLSGEIAIDGSVIYE